jgi:flavorubredoxin
MVYSYKAADDIEVLTSDFPIPGYGLVPINAFVIKGKEPVLVDTGPVVERKEFMTTLRAVIDPMELRWLWLTHTDFDHVGCLRELLAENPRLRLITTFLGVGIMSLSDPLPLDRVYLVNHGQKIDVGDRTLTGIRPPAFDNPCTTGFFDSKSRVFFSADCFGALLSEIPRNAADLPDQILRDGQIFWATVDSPWLHKVDRTVLAKELDTIRGMEPTMILSSHLPAAGSELTDRLLGALADAPTAPFFVGPDQAALQEMLKSLPKEPQ